MTQPPEATGKIDNFAEIKDAQQHIITAVCLVMLSDIFGAKDGIMLGRIIHLLNPGEVQAPALVSINELAKFMKLSSKNTKKVLVGLEENGWIKLNSIQSDDRDNCSIILTNQSLHKFKLAGK